MAASSVHRARAASSEELYEQLSKRSQDIDRLNSDGSVELKGRNGQSATLAISRPSELKEEQKSSIVELFETNMKTMYEASHAGYHPEDKRRELFDPESRFITLAVAPDVSSPDTPTLVAFGMFRFDWEDTMQEEGRAEVVYCYEIQIARDYRACGLGKVVMRCMEAFCSIYSLQKVMLTVFKSNLSARAFYKRLSYENDEICPSLYELDDGEDEPDYEILSKVVRPRSTRTPGGRS